MSRVILRVFLLLSLGFFLATEGLAEDQPIEFFVDGKNYASFEDYQQQKIDSRIKELIESSPEESLVFLKQFLESLTKQERRLISLEHLKGHLKDVDLAEKPRSSDATNAELKEMQDMLKEYQKTHKNVKPLELDADQMKTIIISPNGSGPSKPQETDKR